VKVTFKNQLDTYMQLSAGAVEHNLNPDQEVVLDLQEGDCLYVDHLSQVKVEEEISANDNLKEFYGQVSVVARISFCIKAESEEEAKEKLFNANLPLSLVDDEDKPVCEIQEISWHMVDEPTRGNVRESDLDDFEIREELE